MKAAAQLAITTLALGALLGAAASHATDVAQLPLKASVLAKPNVLIGYDDSGSMDLEVMLDSNDGVYWYDHTNGLRADATGQLFRRIGGFADTQWRRYIYLFPNGLGTGRNLKDMQAAYDYAIPPTTELAFLRSNAYNPQYYNASVTYKPWGEADGYPQSTFPDAAATAARGHPLNGGATNVVDLTSTRARNTNEDYYFVALNGMTLPAGGRYRECANNSANGSCGSWTDVGATDRAARSDRTTHIAMDYWPATYWVKATSAFDCTLPPPPGSSVGTYDCATAPDGTKLRRIEIRSTNLSYPSGRSYAAELQNFANWFQYHRKRRMSANAALSEVLENVNGLNMGIIRMGSRPGTGTRIPMRDLDSSTSSNNAQAILKFVYEIDTNLGTPTRPTLLRLGQEFTASGGPVGYACQRNAALIVTDGYAGTDSVSVPSYTASYPKGLYGSGAPYDTTHNNTLADIALWYYTNPLQPAGSFPLGRVPTTDTDANKNLHMNTYAITLGAVGNVYKGENTPKPTDVSAWVAPTASFDPVAIDDLWHATINGRGQMYLATSADQTAEKMRAAFNDILRGTGAQGGVSVSTVNLVRGDGRAYVGLYDPAGWTGDVTAQPIDKTSGVINPNPSARLWSAAKALDAMPWTSRVIASATTSGGVPFDAASVGSLVNPGGNTYGTTADVMAYLRGDRSKEATEFRKRSRTVKDWVGGVEVEVERTFLMGGIINSEPAVVRNQGVLYVQSGEGMLHAIDTNGADGGKELWAFVPRSVLGEIGKTTRRSYVFRSKLDGSPTVLPIVGGKTVLVAGTGAAGRSFHALDVSNPRGLTEAGLASKFLWEFPAAGDATMQAKVGQSLGRPLIVKRNDGKSVVLVTSGYNNNDGRGRMWMLELNAAGGIAATHEFDTGAAAGDAGLAQVSAFVEDDGMVRYVYGGDLLGNLWRFDLQAKDAPKKLAVLKNASNQLQPVTAAPALTRIEGKNVVVVGTGRLLGQTDFSRSGVETIYAITDEASLANARTSLVQQTLGTSGGEVTVTENAVNFKTGRGWFVDLPAGEQANTRPSIALGAVALTTNINGGSDCTARSKLYLLSLKSGGKAKGAEFVSLVVSEDANSSAVNLLGTTGQYTPPGGGGGGGGPGDCNPTTPGPGLVATGQDGNGNPWCKKVGPASAIQPAKNAWREIRNR